ncbi:MAG: histidinol-phosphate transaminase [Actinobacteria bacterium]|nr:histidinol-phosphate transaminase [Actinomycetota bacterium]
MTKPPIRPDLESLAPYRAPQPEAPVRLNTNECPYSLPAAFADDLAEAVRGIAFNRYPDRDATALRKGLAEHAGHPFEGVWPANGSNEVLSQLLLAFGGPERRVMLFPPTYVMHEHLARTCLTEVIRVPLGEGFRLEEAHAAAVREQRPDLVFVCSPNNPTGNAQDPSAIAAVCEAATGLVVVDEAYAEFAGISAKALLGSLDNLVVVRTFSKAFSLAGARLGYALTTPEIVEDLQRVRLPYHLSALGQAAGETALRHVTDATRLLDAIRDQRDRILAALTAMPGVVAYPSDANFVLFHPGRDGGEVWRALLDRGVLVRDFSTMPGTEGCLRVTAGTPEETGTFLRALEEVLR